MDGGRVLSPYDQRSLIDIREDLLTSNIVSHDDLHALCIVLCQRIMDLEDKLEKLEKLEGGKNIDDIPF